MAGKWKRSAHFQGHQSVPAWLHALAQKAVKELGDDLPEEVLIWSRGTFRVKPRTRGAEPEESLEVSGLLAGPFGIYRGTLFGPSTEATCFTLVHLPTEFPYLELDRQGHCKGLARDLYRLDIRWHESDPEKVTGPGRYEAERVVRRYRDGTAQQQARTVEEQVPERDPDELQASCRSALSLVEEARSALAPLMNLLDATRQALQSTVETVSLEVAGSSRVATAAVYRLDGTYVAELLDVPLQASGSTREDALANLRTILPRLVGRLLAAEACTPGEARHLFKLLDIFYP